MDIFEVIIEAGIGFAGFAGVVIVLSGDSKNWLLEEKLRMALMLMLFLTPLFASFATLVVGEELSPQEAGYWISIITGVWIITACIGFLLMSRKFYGVPGTTYSVGVAIFGQLSMVSISLFTLINAFVQVISPLTVLSGLLVWSLFIGSIIFLRILFLRPRNQGQDGANKSD